MADGARKGDCPDQSLQFVRFFFFFSFPGTTRIHACVYTDRLTDSLAVEVHTCTHMSVKKMFAGQKGGDTLSPG